MSEMSGVFAINKPSGISSSKFLSQIQQIFTSSPNFSAHLSALQGAKVQEIQRQGQKASRRKLRSVLKVKMGHGGTLDPLASGVLVIGVNNGTKKLQNYLNGSIKTYETEALFGISTTTGDVEGEILTKNGVSHIKQEDINSLPEKFLGDLRQTPPIFAALKMNGKPLYEYARQNIPLPMEIKSRMVKIHTFEVFPDTLSLDHQYERLGDSELVQELSKNPTLNENKLYLSTQYMESQGKDPDQPVELGPAKPWEEGTEKLPLLHFKTQVSSGTYIRSLISDVGKSLNSSSYMVKLIREQQAEWELGKNVFELSDFEKRDDAVWGRVLKEVFAKGGEGVSDLSKLFQEAQAAVDAEKAAEAEANAVDGVEEDKNEIAEEESGISKDAVENPDAIEEPPAKKQKTE